MRDYDAAGQEHRTMTAKTSEIVLPEVVNIDVGPATDRLLLVEDLHHDRMHARGHVMDRELAVVHVVRGIQADGADGLPVIGSHPVRASARRSGRTRRSVYRSWRRKIGKEDSNTPPGSRSDIGWCLRLAASCSRAHFRTHRSPGMPPPRPRKIRRSRNPGHPPLLLDPPCTP